MKPPKETDPSPPTGAGKGAAATPKGKPKAKPEEEPEIGGPGGPEPTRYGDWERKGRCIDF